MARNSSTIKARSRQEPSSPTPPGAGEPTPDPRPDPLASKKAARARIEELEGIIDRIFAQPCILHTRPRESCDWCCWKLDRRAKRV